MICTHILFKQERSLFSVMFAFWESQARTDWKNTCTCTQESDHSNAVYVKRHSGMFPHLSCSILASRQFHNFAGTIWMANSNKLTYRYLFHWGKNIDGAWPWIFFNNWDCLRVPIHSISTLKTKIHSKLCLWILNYLPMKNTVSTFYVWVGMK